MQKANSNSWKHQPFGAGVAILFHTTLTEEQFQRAQWGVIPQQMEHKWFVYYEEPYLYFHRSWTGQPIYRLKFERRGGLAEVVESLMDAERTSQPGIDVEYETRLLDFLLYALVLREPKEFPMPADMPTHPKGLFQHHISGTAYPESVLIPDKTKQDKE